MGPLSEHFAWEQFYDPEKIVPPPPVRMNLAKTAKILDEVLVRLRSGYGDECAIVVLQGYTEEGDEQLRLGKGAVVKAEGVTPQRFFTILLEMQREGKIGGLKLFSDRAHVDWGRFRRFSHTSAD